MRILLISPPYILVPGEPKHLGPPLGLAYIASVLLKQKVSVKILDCAVEDYENEYHLNDGTTIYGLSIDNIIKYIVEYSPDVIGLSLMFSLLNDFGHELCKAIKVSSPDTKIVLGGSHATVMADELIKFSYIDFVIRGEGDYAFSELIEYLLGNRSIDNVRSITWKSNENIHSNPQIFIDNLDLLPLPSRSLLNIEQYIRIGRMQGFETTAGHRVTTMITSRGCPARCIFCSIQAVWGNKFRPHSPAYVLNELEHLKNDYNMDYIVFEDDNLTFDKDRATQIFQGMIDKNLNIKWTAPNGVALWRLDVEMLELMKRSGCMHIALAFESGDQHTLTKIIKKPLVLSKIKHIPVICRKLGINTTGFFVIGFPGETIESIERSLDYAVNSEVDNLLVMVATPYPGTVLYDICCNQGYINAQDFSFYKLMTRTGQIETPEFSPSDLDRMIAKTLLRFSLRHPMRNGLRVIRRLCIDPKNTFLFLKKKASDLFVRSAHS